MPSTQFFLKKVIILWALKLNFTNVIIFSVKCVSAVWSVSKEDVLMEHLIRIQTIQKW